MIWKYSGEVWSDWVCVVSLMCQLEGDTGHSSEGTRAGHWPGATASANICTFLYVLCSSLYRQSQNDNPSLEEFPAPGRSNSGWSNPLWSNSLNFLSQPFLFKIEHSPAKSSLNPRFSPDTKSHKFGRCCNLGSTQRRHNFRDLVNS